MDRTHPEILAVLTEQTLNKSVVLTTLGERAASYKLAEHQLNR